MRADLAEGVDYLLTQKGEQLPSGMKYSIEYHLTLEACEHIALMSSTVKGKEIRKEYIAIRRKFLTDQRIAFEAEAREQIEDRVRADASSDRDIGASLKDAIRMSDYDNAVFIDRMLDTMDLEGAARTQGISVEAVRRSSQCRGRRRRSTQGLDSQ